MASSTLQKLLRTQSRSAINLFSHFQKPSSFLLTKIPQISSQPKTDYTMRSSSITSHVYPTFSLGFFLNPISPPTLIRSESDDYTTPDGDDSRTIRADSVKKKRKKKMNKHKLSKLRKRLRRKT